MPSCPPDFGSLQFRSMTGRPQPTYPANWSISPARENVLQAVSTIGRSSPVSERLFDYQPLSVRLRSPRTPSPQDRTRPMNMFTRRLLGSPEPPSHWEHDQCNAIELPIGMPYLQLPSQVPWTEYPQMWSFDATVTYEELPPTICNLLGWFGKSGYFVVQLGRVNQEEPGRKQAWQLTLKILTPSSGTVIDSMNMLSSMNLEEVSRSAICSDGWTDIQSSWKLKEAQYPCVLR